VIDSLLDPNLFKDREPQQFGMVSFTEVRSGEISGHRERFGPFGIAVSPQWALAHHAQRVIYVDRAGPVLDTLRWLFALGKQEFDARVPDAGIDSMALKNKAMAGMYGAALYANLLTLYEFMQPERDSAQVEWRIVEKLPAYHDEADRKKLIVELLETVKVWKHFGSVRIDPPDVMALVCPRKDVGRVRTALPDKFRHVRTEPYATAGPIERVLNRLATAVELRRLAKTPQIPGSVARPEPASYQVRGVAELPFAARIQGLELRPDPVLDAFLCHISYTDEQGSSLQLTTRVLDALYLLNLLREIEKRFPELKA
jgi:hypothetical protein